MCIDRHFVARIQRHRLHLHSCIGFARWYKTERCDFTRRNVGFFWHEMGLC